ncbi:hypothetical protein GCM10011390_20430 [Aureimonas endophytica]|uniref:Uncharacterized protein n=1 Tax=Aureimonas endophytica TaxID=2027858 RepID=A0A916ZJU9_9HYPH|nr:hypothetical protein GCM10011390_20430 [Aureimonas endophytica]
MDRAHRRSRGSGPLDEKTRSVEANALGIGDPRMQQPQPAGWAAFTDSRLFVRASLAAKALRWIGFRPAMAGALRMARGTMPPQVGQAHGSWNSAIGRIAVNGPQVGQA